jgi:hypothetical protein
MGKEVKFKVLVKHSKNCRAIQPQNRQHGGPWCGLSPDDGPNAKFGSMRSPLQRGHTLWTIWICNSTSCAARLAVNSEVILASAPVGETGNYSVVE